MLLDFIRPYYIILLLLLIILSWTEYFYLKYTFLQKITFMSIHLFIITLSYKFITLLPMPLYSIFLKWKILLNSIKLKFLVTSSLIFTLKFIILISLLVFIRGGIPRYRYDFLTKLGWLKFLSLVLIIFLITLVLNYTF